MRSTFLSAIFCYAVCTSLFQYYQEALQEHAFDSHATTVNSSCQPTPSKRQFVPQLAATNRRQSNMMRIEAVGDDFSIPDRCDFKNSTKSKILRRRSLQLKAIQIQTSVSRTQQLNRRHKIFVFLPKKLANIISQTLENDKKCDAVNSASILLHSALQP